MTVFVTEYNNQPVDAGQGIAVGQEPGNVFTIAETAGNVEGDAFAADTKFVRVHSTVNILFEFGPTTVEGGPPTAANGSRLLAGTTEFFGVVPGGKQTLAVTTSGA